MKKNRSSRSQMFLKIGVLKNFPNFIEKRLWWGFFLIKLQALRYTLFTEHFQWLLLKEAGHQENFGKKKLNTVGWALKRKFRFYRSLTHSLPIFIFKPPWKLQKTFSFFILSGGPKENIWRKSVKAKKLFHTCFMHGRKMVKKVTPEKRTIYNLKQI